MAAVDTLRFGKYEILEELGRGGMGVVYKARDPIIGRLVALKTLTAGLAADPDMLRRFYREAQAAGRLQHPNIITIYDMGDAEGRPYIAMSFLEGESLEKIIARRAPMTLAQKLGILLQFCRGLDFAHKHDVVHRDVKPGNIFVKNDGTVTVLDFGIVHIAATTMTQSGMIIGTPQYMSPEQISGQHIDHRSDIFSVGTVAYELLSYTRPFDGPNLPSVVFKIKFEKPPVLSELVPGIPPAVEQAVMRCLEQRPEDRFQSLEDLVLELEPLEQSLKRQMIGDLVMQGQALYQKGEYSKAKEVLRDVLILDSTHGIAKDLMARINSELRRLEVASKVERLVEEGNVLLNQGKPTEAKRALEEAHKLDSQHPQAKTLLDEAHRRIERDRIVRTSISALQAALNTGNLTMAEAELTKIRELDADNPEVRNFQERIRQARAHERRLRIQQALLFPRHLLIQERYAELLEQLEELSKEFPDEPEINDLLATGRQKFQEQTRRKETEEQLQAVKRLIAKQQFEQAAEMLNRLRAEPERTREVADLYESVQRQLEAAKSEQQLERELAAIQELIRAEKYDSAVKRASALQVQHPDSAEVRQVLEFAQGFKQTVEQQKEVAALCRAIQTLLDSGKHADAIREAGAALSRFPDNPALANLLNATREAHSQEAERLEQDRIKRQIAVEIDQVNNLLGARDFAAAQRGAEELEKKYRGRREIQRLAELVRTSARADERAKVETHCHTVQALLDAGNPEHALQEAERALHEFPGNVDITALWMTARRLQREQAIRQQQEAEARALSVESSAATMAAIPGTLLEDQLKTAIVQIEQREFDQAARLLRELEAQHPDDARVREILHEAEQGAAAQVQPSATMVFEPGRTAGDAIPPAPISRLAEPVGPPAADRQSFLAAPGSVSTPVPPSRAPLPQELKLPLIPLWKRPVIVGAAAVATLVLALVIIELIPKPPAPPKPTPPIPPKAGDTASLRALEAEAQDFEGKHQLAKALSDWQTLAGSSGSLQQDGSAGADRVNKAIMSAKQLFARGKQAEQLRTSKGYQAAKDDFTRALQIDADLAAETDQAMAEVDAAIAGKAPEEIEQENFDKGLSFLKAKKYLQAQAAFQSVTDRNLPGSALVPKASEELKTIENILQDQQEFDTAVQEFNKQESSSSPQYADAQRAFTDLAGRDSEWKAQAQDYLGKITDAENLAKKNAAKAIADARMKDAESKVQEKIEAKQYGQAAQLLPAVESAGGDTQAVKKRIEGAYNSELSADKLDAANNPADTNLNAVMARVQDLAQRAGEPLNKSALDYENTLQKQIAGQARVSPPPAPPGGSEAPVAATTTALHPRIAIVPKSLQEWTNIPPPIVDARYVEGGVDKAAELTLPDGINARAKPHDHIDLFCSVKSDGSVMNCTSEQVTALAQAIAAYGQNWKFKSPQGALYLNQGKKRDRLTEANVTISVDY